MAWWFKMDAAYFRNPKVMQAGRYGRELFLYFLCLNAEHDLDGRIPAKFTNQRYLASALQYGNPAQVADGLEGCKEARLITVTENGDAVIVGWSDEWRPRPSTSAQRAAAYRARRRRVTERDADVTTCDADVTDEPVTESNASVTERDGVVTNRHAGVTERDAIVTMKRDERDASRGSEIWDLGEEADCIQPRKTGDPPVDRGSKPRRRAGEPSGEHQRFIAGFTELFEKHSGAKPLWNAKRGKQVADLLKSGLSADELLRRARNMFEAPPEWIARDGARDFGTFLAHLDKFVVRHEPAQRAMFAGGSSAPVGHHKHTDADEYRGGVVKNF